jgi:hypothetical protein
MAELLQAPIFIVADGEKNLRPGGALGVGMDVGI